MRNLTINSAHKIIQDHIFEATCIMGENILEVASKIVFLADVSTIQNKMIVANLIDGSGGVRKYQETNKFNSKRAN